MPSNQQQIIEPNKFTYSPLEQLLKKKQPIEDQRKKQTDALVALKRKNNAKVKLDKTLSSIFNDYFKDRLNEIKK